MLIKIKYIFYLASLLIFTTLTTSFYFSEQNIRATNKSRSFYVVKLHYDTLKLPLLVNDTNDIIEYRNDVQEFRDKIKKRIFEGLIIQGNRIADRIIEPTNVNSDIPSDGSFYVFLGVGIYILIA